MIDQRTRGLPRRLMYVENRNGGLIDGCPARIGWVTFSKTGKTVYYRDLELASIGSSGILGNFMYAATREEYWISGVKKHGSNNHPKEGSVRTEIDADALDAYQSLRAGG